MSRKKIAWATYRIHQIREEKIEHNANGSTLRENIKKNDLRNTPGLDYLINKQL